MKAAGLMAIDTVLDTTAVLVESRKSTNSLVDLINSRIQGVIGASLPSLSTTSDNININRILFSAAKRYVLCQYNIPRNLLAAATKVTPGKRAPTVTALEEPDWVAVSSMVEKKDIANVMDQLSQSGATDILVLTIANSRTF